MRQVTVAAAWVLTIVAGVVLAEGWRPWSTIVGTVVFLGWMVTIASFVQRNHTWRPAFLRKRHPDKPT